MEAKTQAQEKAVSIIKKDENKAVMIQKGTSLFFDIAKFEHAHKVAQLLAKSTMVPAQFQNNLANCVIALNLAERMQTDPYMLMQNMYIVHGKPGIEAKMAIGLINQSGRFSELEYEMSGKDDDFSCRAYAKKLSTGKVLYGPKVDIAMAKAEGWYNKPGSKWKTMPELMLQYRAAMFFVRVYCPDVLLGMRIREELQEIVDITPTEVVFPSGAHEKPEVTQETYQAQKINSIEPIEKNKAADDKDLIDSFMKLNKVSLGQFEQAHREKISNWPQEIKDSFYKKWETKMKISYDIFLRRLKIINGTDDDIQDNLFNNKDSKSDSEHNKSMGTVKCPESKEIVTLAFCKNARGQNKPCERYIAKDCLARWSE